MYMYIYSILLTVTFILVYQRAYIVLIHERFIENKIKQFVDFCSISNVSTNNDTGSPNHD